MLGDVYLPGQFASPIKDIHYFFFFLVPVAQYLTKGDLSEKGILLAYISVGTECGCISAWHEGQGKRIRKQTGYNVSTVKSETQPLDLKIRSQPFPPAFTTGFWVVLFCFVLNCKVSSETQCNVFNCESHSKGHMLCCNWRYQQEQETRGSLYGQEAEPG